MRTRPEKNVLDPDPELWEALERGAILRRVLVDFYGRVYRDPRLSSFFRHATMERAIEKQFSFLASIFTGERLYFGWRPRNGHHWMVISDELFDYREELLASCLRRAGLDEVWVARIRAVDEAFRKQIVKDAPIPLRMNGVDMPLDGYDEVELSIGTLCDQCGREIGSGIVCRYHRRTGFTFCSSCPLPPDGEPVPPQTPEA